MKRKLDNIRNRNNDTYKLERQYISRCGLKVESYKKVMTDDERAKCREAVTEEIVRILKAAGKI